MHRHRACRGKVISLTDSCIKHSTLRRSHGSGLWRRTRQPDSLQRQVSALDHTLVLGVFARSVRLVVADVKRRTAFVVMTSEKSIARSAGMYNIRFDLRADRKLDRMKRLRRYNRKQSDETVPRFWGGAGFTLRRRYFAFPLFYLQRRKSHSMNQRFGVCSIRRNRRLLVEASTHVFEHAGVVCGGVSRAT